MHDKKVKKMNKIQTAEEWLKAECPSYDKNPVEYLTNNDIYYQMREFAKEHVKAALEAAAENVNITEINSFPRDEYKRIYRNHKTMPEEEFIVDKDSILNACTEKLIV